MKKFYFIFFVLIISTVFSSCIDYNSTISETNSNDDISETVSINIDQSKAEEPSKLIVNEFLPINSVNIKDATGTFSPWIEIKNISNESVDLSSYIIRLTSGANIATFELDDLKIDPNELHLIIIGDLIDDFYFSSDGSVEILSDNSKYTFNYSGAKPNHSYSESGESIITTPGYTEALPAEKLSFSEIMSSNKTIYKYNFCDWIELYNDSDNQIDLSKYYISDDISDPYKCRLPDQILNGKDFFVAICDGKEINFNISSKGEDLYLTRNDGMLIDKINIPEINADHSFTNDIGATRFPCPGYQNDYQGYLSYIKDLKSPLVLNEVMSSNLSYKPINKKYYDWIELKNCSDHSIQLSDYYISNKYDSPQKYKLPDISLAANDTYVLYASGKGGDHANFKISSDLEYLYIFDNKERCIDSIYVSDIPTNKSFGRYNGERVYFNDPTPDQENSFGFPTISETPKSSHHSGFYDAPIVVRLEAEGDIFYTLDGSEPNRSSNKYVGETIIIENNTSLRAVNYNGERIKSKYVTYNYFFDTPSYSLPILKISIDDDDLYGENGFYTNFNDKLEKKINLSFYVDGIEEFNIDCGISIAGQGSRVLPKKSMEVKFKSEYGASKLKYDIFGSEMTEFDTLMLRGGSEDQTRSLFRDEFFTSLVGSSSDMTVWVQNQRPCNLYINDEYFGIYFIRERLNDHYYASYLDVDENLLDVIYYWRSNEYGLLNDWKKLYSFCENNDLSVDENYKYVESLIDIDNWIDYYISRAYTGDKDLANIRLFKIRNSSDKWKIVLFDLDWAFTVQQNPFYTHFGKLTQKTSNDSTIIYNLFKNDEFKDRFLTRLSLHLNNTLSEDNVISHLENMKSIIEPDIQFEIDRWGQISMNTWTKSISNIASFINDAETTRTEELLQDIKKVLNLSEEEMDHYFGELN